MYRPARFALVAALLAGPAVAQPAPGPAAQQRRGPERPLDVGPFTPEANRAFMGGGVVLQGPPGAPAPVPHAMPPQGPPPPR